MAKDIWQLVHSERDALAADLEGVSDDRWDTASLCDRWTVREVVAHLTATAMMTPPKFFASFAGSGFRFQAFADKELGRHLGASPRQTLDEFRAAAHRTTSPPGPSTSWVGETVVHAEDVRRPLGIWHTYDPGALHRVADFYSRSNALIGSKKRIEGVRLESTDTDWAVGSGPTARGPMLSILMAVVGRKAAIDDLTGDGADALRSRS